MVTTLVVLLLPVLLTAVAVVWVYHNQSSLLFIPSKTTLPPIPEIQDRGKLIRMETQDHLQLEGWYCEPPRPKAPVILFFHGNSGNLTTHQITDQRLLTLDCGLLLIDYRGYGNSEGIPSEEGLHRDATAAWKWLRETAQIPASHIVLHGRSLGASVAARLAATEAVDCRALIMESGFSSLDDMRETLYPFFPASLSHYSFCSLEWVALRHCPLLIAHSPQENYIPFAQAEKLFHAARPPKRLFRLTGGHGRGWEESWPDYGPVLKNFAHSPAILEE